MKAAEEDEANGKLLEIAEIRLTEDPNAGNNEDEDEIDDQGMVVAKNNGAVDDEDDGSDDGGDNGNGEDKKERQRRRKQFNDKYELDKLLLYLIFAKATNQGIRNQAVKVLVQNFN